MPGQVDKVQMTRLEFISVKKRLSIRPEAVDVQYPQVT